MQTRVLELRHVPAAELHPNPRNWRTHPPEQQRALQSVLSEIGFAGAVLARLRDDGELELVDGHLRTNTAAPTDVLPVLVLDLNETEADKLLAVYDPLAGMATRDDAQLAALLDRIDTDNDELRTLLAEIQEKDALSPKHVFANDISPANLDEDRHHTNQRRAKNSPDTEESDIEECNEETPSQQPQLRVVNVPESFQLLVDCEDEDDQQQLDARLCAEGYSCRVLTL